MSLTNPNNIVTEERLSEFYQQIFPYLGGMPDVVGGGFAPIGTIIAFMGTTAPADYLACDGTAYNIADYPQLSTFIESQFGSKDYFGGDGITTFAVPDLRGEFLRGTGTNSHANQGSGAAVGVHQSSTKVPWIATSANGSKINARKNGTSAANEPENMDTETNKTTGVAQGNLTYSGTASPTSVGEGYTIRPTNTSVLYCIKALCPGEVYSTDERIAGTWIDGKVLYQKVITGTLPSNIVNGTFSNKTIGTISDVSALIELRSILKNSMECYYETNAGNSCKVTLTNGEVVVSCNNAGYSDANIAIIAKYTKTT